MPQIKIERIVHSGLGMGRLPDGKKVFVPYVLPDEEVVVNILENRRDYVFAEPKDIISKSVHRITPKCQYYKLCGGCHLQHTHYENQLTLKKDAFVDTVSRIYGQDIKGLKIEVFPSPKEFHYRHSVRLKVSPFGHLGFNRLRSDQIERIDFCFLAKRHINSFLAFFNNSPNLTRTLKDIESITLETCPSTERLYLVLNVGTKKVPHALNNLLNLQIAGLKVIHKGEVLYNQRQDDSKCRVFSFYDKTMEASPGVFMQHNWDVNLMLVDYLIRNLKETGLESIIDFHAGAGNFILPLGRYFKKRLACDINTQALVDLRNNMKRWGQDIEIHNLSAEGMLKMLTSKGEQIDVVLIDPPRGGCKDLAQGIHELNPKIIVYISCDPPSLARDLKILRVHGYVPEKIAIFDMFPQTFHIESVTILRRENLS